MPENEDSSEQEQSETSTQDENQNSVEEDNGNSSEEDGPPFHPHRGKILRVLPYTEISSISFDKSYEDSTANGKVELLFQVDDRKYIYDGVACKLKIRRDTDRQFSSTGIEEIYTKDKDVVLREHYPTNEQLIESELIIKEKQFVDKNLKDFDVDSTIVCRSSSDDGLYGFVTDVKHSQKSSEITLKDWGYCLEDTGKKLSFSNLLRSQIIEEVIKSYGLTPIVDFEGLDDETISWKNEKSVGSPSSQSSQNDGDVSVNGDGSMTEDQAWEIYKTFKYGSWGSGHDPQKAWEEMGTEKGHSADCYDATAWMYYVYNYKIGIPARDICYPSAAAIHSGTHHIVQIYKNGKWIVPEQYSGITSGLGGSEQSKYHVCREPPKNGNQPEYERCPWSRND